MNNNNHSHDDQPALEQVRTYIGNLLSALVAPPDEQSSLLDRFNELSGDANLEKFLSFKEHNVLQLAVDSVSSSGKTYTISTNLAYKDVGAEYVVLLEKKSQVRYSSVSNCFSRS